MNRRFKKVKNTKVGNNFYQNPRDQMYAYLRKKMHLSMNECHFKKFNTEQCKQAMEIAKTFTYSYRKHE